jgi:hypothetical protein
MTPSTSSPQRTSSRYSGETSSPSRSRRGKPRLGEAQYHAPARSRRTGLRRRADPATVAKQWDKQQGLARRYARMPERPDVLRRGELIGTRLGVIGDGVARVDSRELGDATSRRWTKVSVTDGRD